MYKNQIIIVEDEPVIAAQIELYLEQGGYQVAGIAYDYETALELLEQTQPDAVLLDIQLGRTHSGIKLGSLLHTQYRIPFLYITSYSDTRTLEMAKETFPSGYLVKPFNEAGLIAGLTMALHNNKHLQQAVVLPLPGLHQLNRKLSDAISEREFEIIQQVYAGLSNQQIADVLFLSIHTVKQHLKSIFFKLDVSSRSGMLARVRELAQQ